MKKALTILTLLIISYSIEAQPLIEPRFKNLNYARTEGTYYKDIDNDYAPYVGTWIYTHGNTSFKIVLQKKEMMPLISGVGQHAIQYYTDILIGEYQYIENGIDKVNTLANLSVNHSKPINYSLYGGSIVLKNLYPKCDECAETDRRIAMTFNEPSRRNSVGLSGGLMLRHYVENDVHKIKAIVYIRTSSLGIDRMTNQELPAELNHYSVPTGTYILTKVN